MEHLQQMGVTRWKNPTDKVLRVRIWNDSVRRREVEVFQPGEMRALPAIYDRAIQKVRHGKICGGLAPQLQRVGAEPLPIEPAIDSDAAAKRAARDELQKARALEFAARESVAEAALRVQAASAAATPEPSKVDPDQQRPHGQPKPEAEPRPPTRAQQQGQERDRR